MVSISWETAQATQIRPEFDSPQVHRANLTTKKLPGKGFIHEVHRAYLITSSPLIMAFVTYLFASFSARACRKWHKMRPNLYKTCTMCAYAYILGMTANAYKKIAPSRSEGAIMMIRAYQSTTPPQPKQQG